MQKKKDANNVLSAEEKIKDAARKIFMEKGFAATRTRDIAAESGINLALLNYYFRSKEKLFEIIMQEKLIKFFGQLLPVIDNKKSTIESKVQSAAESYIELLKANYDLPLFILSEMRASPERFVKKIPLENIFEGSVMARQFKAKNPNIDTTHFFFNTLGFCVFPFIMRPAYQVMTKKDKREFDKLMDERKKLIPAWVKAMLKVNMPEK